MDSRRCTLMVAEDFEQNGSYLVKFSNGCLLQSGTSSALKFTLYKKSRNKILVAETDDLTYVGTSFDSESASLSSTCQYCVGALDKSSGVMTLHRTELMTMKPHIPGLFEIEDDANDVDGGSNDTNIDKMVGLFGSERQKRVFSAAKRNRVDNELMEGVLQPAFSHAQAQMEASPLIEPAMQSSGVAPNHNPDAQTPHEVYNINDIVSIKELIILKTLSKTFSEASEEELAEWRSEKRYPEYVLQHIHQLPSEPHRSLKASILLYALFLMQMYDMKLKQVQREGLKFEGIQPPAEVIRQLQATFTEREEGTKRTRIILSSRMKDKICLHLLVLCLFIDDFSVEFLHLQRDLKISERKLKDHFRALGCVVKQPQRKRPAPGVTDSQDPLPTMKAILHVPPSFPKPKLGKKKKLL